MYSPVTDRGHARIHQRDWNELSVTRALCSTSLPSVVKTTTAVKTAVKCAVRVAGGSHRRTRVVLRGSGSSATSTRGFVAGRCNVSGCRAISCVQRSLQEVRLWPLNRYPAVPSCGAGFRHGRVSFDRRNASRTDDTARDSGHIGLLVSGSSACVNQIPPLHVDHPLRCLIGERVPDPRESVQGGQTARERRGHSSRKLQS